MNEPRVLILDEATSALDLTTRDNLSAVVERLRARGVAVLLISHRMDEVEEIADRITVMRSGEKVDTVGRGEATARDLVRMMTGVDHSAPAGEDRPAGGAGAGDPRRGRHAATGYAADRRGVPARRDSSMTYRDARMHVEELLAQRAPGVAP